MQRSPVDGVGENLRAASPRLEEEQPPIVVADDDRPVLACIEAQKVPGRVGEEFGLTGLRRHREQAAVGQPCSDASARQDDDVLGCGTGQLDSTQAGHGTFIAQRLL